jgi:hypothetical protein
MSLSVSSYPEEVESPAEAVEWEEQYLDAFMEGNKDLTQSSSDGDL